MASARAAERGLAIATTCIDLTIDGLPPGPFDLACCFHYRQPGLAERIRPVLRDGAVVVLELATVRNLERHARPSRRFLAEPGELLRELGSFRVPYYSEGWVDDRSLARIVAVK